jgi:protein-tyrosine phosphatase
MKSALRKAGVKNVTVSSAGTAAVDGAKPSSGAALAARHQGLSLAGFVSHPLSQRRVRRADLILTMGPAQSEEIARRWPDARDKTFVICKYTGSPRRAIEDPIGGPTEAYVTCAGELEDEVARVLPLVKSAFSARRRKG